MALIDVGMSEMNRRARARTHTFVSSVAFDRNYASYQKHRADPTSTWTRTQHFNDAAGYHSQMMNKGIRQQKIPARGMKREEIAPRTSEIYDRTGSGVN